MTIASIGATNNFKLYNNFGPYGTSRTTDEKGRLTVNKNKELKYGLE